jgi:hypothetical protein
MGNICFDITSTKTTNLKRTTFPASPPITNKTKRNSNKSRNNDNDNEDEPEFVLSQHTQPFSTNISTFTPSIIEVDNEDEEDDDNPTMKIGKEKAEFRQNRGNSQLFAVNFRASSQASPRGGMTTEVTAS